LALETGWKEDSHVFTVEVHDAEHREMLNNEGEKRTHTHRERREITKKDEIQQGFL
jgi:hypothetical protein